METCEKSEYVQQYNCLKNNSIQHCSLIVAKYTSAEELSLDYLLLLHLIVI